MAAIKSHEEDSIMDLPLKGIKASTSRVQAGPACMQLTAWFGADVVKVGRLDVGDVTRCHLRDIPDLDALHLVAASKACHGPVQQPIA